MAVMEVTRLRVAPEKAEALASARVGMLEAFARREGFVRADLVRVAEDQWLDLIVWERSEDFAESRRRGADSEGIERFFAQIDEVISGEEGRLWRE
jgi:heme-degrading monooxygenase HmoA